MLLTKKMLLTFLIGFLLVVLPGLVGLFDDIADLAAKGDVSFDMATWGTLLAGLIAGAVAAGLRGVLALQPFNLVPTDALHGLGPTPASVTVDKEG